MHIKLIKIGNSKGITLSKAIIDQYNFQGDIELELKKEGLLLKPMHVLPREKWDEAYKKLNKKSKPITDTIEYLENDFDKNEWTW